jgi:hypothetical protein
MLAMLAPISWMYIRKIDGDPPGGRQEQLLVPTHEVIMQF